VQVGPTKAARIHADSIQGLKNSSDSRSVPLTRGGAAVTDERLIDIESKMAHQEHTLAELNDALANQQTQIAHLELQVRTLIERIRTIAEAAPGGAEDEAPPPHY
jgi:SlyX protein